MYISGNDYPFNSKQFYQYLEDLKYDIRQEVNSFSSDRLLNTSSNDLTNYFFNKYEINSIPTLDEPIISQQRDTKIRNQYYRGSPFDYEYFDGVAIDFEVSFIGSSKYFRFQPSTFSLSYPHISILNDKICFSLNLLKNEYNNQETINNEVTRTISTIENGLENLRKDAENFNNKLEEYISNLIKTRKDDLLARQNLVSNLGFKLKPRNNSETYVVNVKKKKIDLVPPEATTEPYKPEPTLSETNYDEILKTLDLMSQTMEKSPSAFKEMDEESIRTHFLVNLNGMFEGNASGETFNKNGKTDILISVNGKNIFIGECKFWKGEKLFLDTIDQILGYLTWRDTKACILVFNRKKNLSDVLIKIKDAVPKHKNYKKTLQEKSETDFRYLFASNEDRNREIFLAVKVYDVPTE